MFLKGISKDMREGSRSGYWGWGSGGLEFVRGVLGGLLSHCSSCKV
jgi:hypothetical protein